MVSRSEAIVEGTVESYSVEDPGHASAMIRIDKVWKGDVTPHVIVLFGSELRSTEWWPNQSKSSDCPAAVQVGERVRLGVIILDEDVLQFDGTALAGPTDIVGWPGPAFREPIDMQLHDPALDPLLSAYATSTEGLRQAAATGGKQPKLAFAEHLLANHEEHRAFELYDGLLQMNPNDFDLLLIVALAKAKTGFEGKPDVTLADVEQRAPKTKEWHNKIVHAHFMATGLLTPDTRDWSDVKRTNEKCYSDHANLDGADFDRSDFAGCAFRYSSFRGASFRGTDLTGSYFQDSDLTGAKYDCATKLPDDLDPAAAHMINVDGTCPTPNP